MAKNATYAQDNNVTRNDFLLGSDAEGGEVTKNFKIGKIIDLALAEYAEGIQGEDGLSAYQVAVSQGFVGSVGSWLASLIGDTGSEGASAYQVAIDNGFEGTESEWLSSLTVSAASALEYSSRIYQAGTGDPIPQSPQINTIDQGVFNGADTAADYREVLFKRTAVGTYSLKIRFKTSGFVSSSRVAVLFGDNVCRMSSTSNGGEFGLYFIEYIFKTYDPLGTVSDSQLMGNNGTFVNIKIYP